MSNHHHPLPFVTLPPGLHFIQPQKHIRDRIHLELPAADVMIDFTHARSVAVIESETVDEARARMIQTGVRLLFVVGYDNKFLVLITSDDVLGAKPVQIAAQQGIHHDEVLIRDVMQSDGDLQTLNLNEVQAAKVGHIVATLNLTGHQVMLVVNRSANGDIRLCGLFCAPQIFHDLKMDVQPVPIAITFSEIEVQLSR